ncbi:VOC family protein [Rubrimonas cliftonensis]|uniref:Methylmalonyl-CoA/ethylmalonyl-CoA epimerase n=1 Tax=Rubrimonas cliftonensis TaxID=89524 RepID=A0A1H4CVR0_9RHOB|nr:VOC family protein [Rubrimonas cliftonensis]SEA64495.1 methylmalonyl-CoA/ethylmalonyl-CoA epimerase [Rubrimonas cliftonensis]
MTDAGALAAAAAALDGPPRLHHVGVVQPDFEAAEAFMALTGLKEAYRGYVEPFACWCLFCCADGPTAIELVVPNGGQLAKFNRGAGGLHHYAVEVADLDVVRDRYAARGASLLMPEHVKGAGPFLCNFLSPISTRGVQIEFVQPI